MIRYYPFISALAFRVGGKDSERYLNARLTQDVRALNDHGLLEAAILNPQGRTQGFFQVLKITAGDFILICTGGDAASVEAALKKYIVADRVDVAMLHANHKLIHIFNLKAGEKILAELCRDSAVNFSGGFFQCNSIYAYPKNRSAEQGIDILIDNSSAAALLEQLAAQKAVELDAAEADRLRIMAGIPYFPSELNEDHIFAESGLKGAVSYNKGCYVGQEVMEKLDSMGRTPKILKLIRLHGRQQLLSGTAVYFNDSTAGTRAIGKTLSSCYDEQTGYTYSFASIKNDEALSDAGITVNQASAEIVS